MAMENGRLRSHPQLACATRCKGSAKQPAGVSEKKDDEELRCSGQQQRATHHVSPPNPKVHSTVASAELLKKQTL
jgi:hypothetical protein